MIQTIKELQETLAAIENFGLEVKRMQEAQDQILKMLEPIQMPQLAWIANMAKIAELMDGKPENNEIRLIEIKGNTVRFEVKEKRARKDTSIHFLILKALLTKSDEDCFASYDDIDKFLVDSSLEEITDKRKKRKRILDGKRQIPRFLGVEPTYNDFEIIEIVEEKGLRLHNPVI
jgi:hypothetical protein